MRRMWMLLLALVLTVVIMAVPAMAEEAHTHGTCNYAGTACDACAQYAHESDSDWNKLSEAGDTISADGKYYVDQETVTKSITVSGGNVVICLNGNTWAGSGTTRPLTVTGGTVTIVDCGALLEGNSYVTEGVIKGVQMVTELTGVADTTRTTANSGGTICVEYGTVHFYNGTITGGTANNGGNVALFGSSSTAKAYFYLNGGQIKGAGQSNYASYASSTKISTVKSLADGGIANNRGGNVLVENYAEFHMGNELTAEIGDGYAVPCITGGNTLYKQGGNLSVSKGNGYFYLKSGVVKDGFSTDCGGNVHLEAGKIIMTGGKITGGKRRTNASEDSANIHMNTGTFTLSGGQIDGGMYVQQNTTNSAYRSNVKLSGSPKVLGNGILLNVHATSTFKGCTALQIGDFEDGAEIYVRTTPASVTNEAHITRLVINDDKGFMQDDANGDGTKDWYDYEDAMRYIHPYTDDSNKVALSFEADGIYFRDASDNEIYHCVCCADQPAYYNKIGKIVHLEGCDRYDHPWKRWPMVSDTTYLPGATVGTAVNAEAGYYYLVEADDGETGTAGDGVVSHNQQQSNFRTAGKWHIDMNGLTVSTCRRVVALFDDTDTDVTFTDSKGGGGFRWYTDTAKYNNSGYFWVRHVSPYANSANKELTAYRITLDGSALTLTNKLVSVDCGTACFYGTTIKGATCSAGVGGAIGVANGGNLTLDDCTVTGGSATTTGGCINFDSTGTLTIRNSTISGGTAKNGGNTLYINKGETEIADSKIDGGVYYNNGTLTLSGDVKINDWGNGLESGIFLATGKKLTLGTLDKDADIVICVDGGEVGTALSNEAVGLTADHFSLSGSDLYLTVDNGVLKLTDTLAEGTKVVRNGCMLTVWPANMSDGDYVKLFAKFENVAVPANIVLDLNGQALTNLTFTGSEAIKLFDSSAINYVAGTGYVTLANGQANPFVREFLTGGVIDRNLRFVTIKESNGNYSAHRIYLAVRSTVLYPKATVVIDKEAGTKEQRVALGYRIALRCDDTLADYISDYGLIGKGTTSMKVPVTGYYGDGANNDNNKIIGISFDTKTEVADKTITGTAYLTITDGISAGGEDLTSGAVETTLKTLVESAYLKYYRLSEALKTQLDWMKQTYSTVMSGWNTTLPVSQEGFDALDGKKILFIGNSYTFWGNCVISVPTTTNQENRTGDQGLFYQLCKANGINVEVTNWTFGSHNLSDSMGTACSVSGCNGKNHLSELKDTYFDYVAIQLFLETKFDGTLIEYLSDTMELFRAANPDVKFLFLVPRDAYSGRFAGSTTAYQWVDQVDTLTDEGVLVCNWGNMIHDIEIGETLVPNAELNYTQSSFVISRNATDGHHQNMLVGYLTALMAYSAITGDSAVGQPYDFCDDPTIHPNFDLEAYKEKYYTHVPSSADENYAKLWPNGYVETNFVEIMRSEADMNGLQQLVDTYLAQYDGE